MEGMKKSYHSACKEEKLAASRETNSKLESSNPEAQKKLQEKLEKCQQEVQKVGLFFHSGRGEKILMGGNMMGSLSGFVNMHLSVYLYDCFPPD